MSGDQGRLSGDEENSRIDRHLMTARGAMKPRAILDSQETICRPT